MFIFIIVKSQSTEYQSFEKKHQNVYFLKTEILFIIDKS